RVHDPHGAIQQRGHVPGQAEERQREHEEQVDDGDDDAIDQAREEPADPMFLQGRVASDQVNGRRHSSPIRRRRYRTRLHKSIGLLLFGPTIESQSVESADAPGGNSSSTRCERRRNSPGTSFDVYTVLPALWITTPDDRALFASISRIRVARSGRGPPRGRLRTSR